MAEQVIDSYVEHYRGEWLNPSLQQNLSRVNDEEAGQILVNSSQINSIPQMDQFSLLPCSQNNPTFGSGATNYQFRMVKGAYTFIEDFSISVVVVNADNTYPVTTCNPFFFFQQIEATGNGGNVHIQYLYPEGMWHYFANYLTNDQQLRLAADMRISHLTYLGRPNNIPAGATVQFVIPLLGNFVAENGGLYFPGLSDDFVWNFQLGSQPVASYAGANAAPLSVSNFNLNIHYQEYPSDVKKALGRMMQSSVIEYGFLESYRTPLAPVTYTAGSSVITTLSSIKGFTPYLIFGLRSNNSPTSNGYTTFTPLGDYSSQATVEIDAQGGRMITGQYPWPADMLRNIESAKHFPGPGTRRIPGLYSIFFGSPTAAEMSVRKEGGMYFTSFENINIKCGAAATAETPEVWTITPSGTASTASTYWQITLTNLGSSAEVANLAVTTAPLAYNASLAQINAALKAVLVNTVGFNKNPINVVATGTLFSSGTGGLVLTISNQPDTWINAGILIIGNLGVTFQNVLTTNGIPQTGGFTTGSYSLLLLQKLFCHTHIDNGYWKVYTQQ